MPGATPLGIRYPFQNETVTATSWQNTAEDIDGLLTQLDVLRDTAISKLSAAISGGGVATATGAVGTVTGFTTENWDTGGYADLVANNDRLTVTPGIYWTQCRATLSTVTTITSARCALLVGGGAVFWHGGMVDTIGGTSVACNSTGIVVVTIPATIFQIQVRWVGTGGPGTWANGRLEAYKVRDLANV